MSDCTVVNLPVVTADFCSPNINFGQIKTLYLGNSGNPLTDWTDLAEWNTKIDNADTADAAKIKKLHVIGDKPSPERGTVEFSQGRTAYTTPEHTINFRIDETDDNNYALIQFLEANAGQTIQVWYEGGKYLYGGNTGVSATIVLDDIIPESDEELNTFNGTIVWEGNHPARILSPLA